MPTTTYAHFRDAPKSSWRWQNFSPAEIACRGTGENGSAKVCHGSGGIVLLRAE
jgi:hypothetical protein